VENLTWWWI